MKSRESAALKGPVGKGVATIKHDRNYINYCVEFSTGVTTTFTVRRYNRRVDIIATVTTPHTERRAGYGSAALTQFERFVRNKWETREMFAQDVLSEALSFWRRKGYRAAQDEYNNSYSKRIS